MSNNPSRKRAAAPLQPPPAKQALMTQEEEFMDEDVFTEQTLGDIDQTLCDIEQRQTLAARLSKWKRPPLSADYVAHSRSVGEYFSLINCLIFGVRILFYPVISGILLFCALSLRFRLLVFQQLEIDDVIGESHRELLPNLFGPAAIIRIFGVTKEGLLVFLLSSCYTIWFLRQLEINIACLFVYSVVRKKT